MVSLLNMSYFLYPVYGFKIIKRVIWLINHICMTFFMPYHDIFRKGGAPVILTLSEGGVRGTSSFSEADGGAVMCFPVLGGEGSHGWVWGPCTQEGRWGGRGVC